MATKKPPRTAANVASGAGLPAKASSPASYAILAMNTGLSIHGAQVRRDGAKWIYAERGADVASMELVGAELVVEFLEPANLDVVIDNRTGARLRDFLHHFEQIRGRPGWRRYRRPATRDPRPDLESRVGPMIGQAALQRRAT